MSEEKDHESKLDENIMGMSRKDCNKRLPAFSHSVVGLITKMRVLRNWAKSDRLQPEATHCCAKQVRNFFLSTVIFPCLFSQIAVHGAASFAATSRQHCISSSLTQIFVGAIQTSRSCSSLAAIDVKRARCHTFILSCN